MRIQKVLDYQPGGIPNGGIGTVFTTTSPATADILMTVSGSCWAAPDTGVALNVIVDGNLVGSLRGYQNKLGTAYHMTLPTHTFKLNLAPGTHGMALQSAPGVLTDGNDFFDVAVIESDVTPVVDPDGRFLTYAYKGGPQIWMNIYCRTQGAVDAINLMQTPITGLLAYQAIGDDARCNIYVLVERASRDSVIAEMTTRLGSIGVIASSDD